MTLAEIERRLSAIRHAAEVEGDDETAHSLEDELHRNVLQAIATDEGNLGSPQILADAALRSLDIDFSRWCG